MRQFSQVDNSLKSEVAKYTPSILFNKCYNKQSLNFKLKPKPRQSSLQCSRKSLHYSNKLLQE